MKIKQNAFGDWLVYKGCINKGYTLKHFGRYRVFNKAGLIGHIAKKDGEYISYDTMWNPIETGEFEELLLHFFQ